MNSTSRLSVRWFWAIIATLAVCSIPARALTIIPVWDTTITIDPNAAVIESSINMAIQFYEARFADPITVSIQFEEMTEGLGESEFEFYDIAYSDYLSALQSDATTTNDSIALGSLPSGPNNPVTDDANISVHTANLKALGFVGYDPGYPNGIEGYVLLNTSIMNLSRTNISKTKYDLISVAEHEMDEVLAFSSELPQSGEPFPQDLFRYTSAGARTFTTNGDDAYFSIDGKTMLVQFNQKIGGDFGDWWSTGTHTPRVQDAYSTAGATPNPNVELVGLDVIGFDLIPPPRPVITSLDISGSNLVINGTNGLATATYYLLTGTNLNEGLSQWTSVWTNVLTANGSFSIIASNAVKAQTRSQYYVLQMQ